jgi:TetR/AcrR family transcriptional regulator, transcriptional repressor for nem operon
MQSRAAPRLSLANTAASIAPPGRVTRAIFDHNEDWLAAVLEQGRDEGSLAFTGPARDTARMIVSGLEGAMLVARPHGDAARFQVAAASLLASLTTAPADGPSRG